MENTRFVPDENIEIVRETANSKEECERRKAELEGQGFTVTIREPARGEMEGGYYIATLFAEKSEPVMIDTWAGEQEKIKLKKRERQIDITTKAGFWIILVLGLLFLFFLLQPLIRALRAL